MNNKKNALMCMCYALIFLFAMFLVGTSPLLAEISKTFNLSTSQSGTIFTFNFVGFVLFVLVGGLAADRYGKKPVLSFSLIGFTISLFAFPLSGNFYAACVIMLFVGGFGGIIEGLISAIVSDINAENASLHVNILQVFFGLGALIGPLMISFLISRDIRWQVSYYIFGTISFILTVAFVFSRLPQMKKTESMNINSIKALISNKKVILVSMCMLFYTGSEVGCWGWMVTFLNESMNFTALKSSMAVGVFWMSMTVGRLVCGPLILRYGPGKVVVWLASFSAFVIILSGIVRNEAMLWTVTVLMGLSFSGLWALIATYGSEGYKEISGTAFSLFIASGGIGGAVVPYLMGLLSEEININIAMVSPSILLFAIAIVFIRFNRMEMLKRQPE